MHYFVVLIGLIVLGLLATQRTINAVWARGFLFFWLFLFFISGFDPYGLFPLSSSTYLILSLFVFSFVIGISVKSGSTLRSGKKISCSLDAAVEHTVFLLNGSFFKFFSFLIVLILSVYVLKFSSYILSAGFEDSRLARFEVGLIFTSVIEAMVFTYIVGGAIWFMKFAFAFSLAFRGVAASSFFLSGLACFLYLVFGGGRNILIEVAFLLMFFLLLKRFGVRARKRAEGRTAKIVFVLMLSFCMAVFATLFRNSSSDNAFDFEAVLDASATLLEHFVVYFVGSFRAFDYAVEHYERLLNFNFGQMGLAGFDEIYALIFRSLGFNTMPFSNYWGEILAEPIQVGGSVFFNALYTAVFNFYFDFGVAGSAIWGGFFGFVCSVLLKRLIASPSCWGLFSVSLLFVVSMLTPLSWKFTSGALALVWVLSLVLDGLSRKKNWIARVDY